MRSQTRIDAVMDEIKLKISSRTISPVIAFPLYANKHVHCRSLFQPLSKPMNV
jgi:hypothetical protein